MFDTIREMAANLRDVAASFRALEEIMRETRDGVWALVWIVGGGFGSVIALQLATLLRGRGGKDGTDV